MKPGSWRVLGVSALFLARFPGDSADRQVRFHSLWLRELAELRLVLGLALLEPVVGLGADPLLRAPAQYYHPEEWKSDNWASPSGYGLGGLLGRDLLGEESERLALLVISSGREQSGLRSALDLRSTGCESTSLRRQVALHFPEQPPHSTVEAR